MPEPLLFPSKREPVTTSPAASVLSVIVDRLRTAGCVFAEGEALLLVAAATSPAELDDMVSRRVSGLPLEHILGWAEFWGLRVAVDPGVFVPRRRTELLVSEALHRVGRSRAPVILDLCCGSGAVGAALAANLESSEVYASDVDPAAVRSARRNITTEGRVFEGDLYAPLPENLRGRVDVIVVNAPYVPTEAIGMMPPEARLHEARVALDGGSDGLDVQRRVVAEAPQWLAPGGHLLIETSRRQAKRTRDIFIHHGFTATIARSDELDGTAVIGTWPSAS
jgi:release factor glutamine methyltransferase